MMYHKVMVKSSWIEVFKTTYISQLLRVWNHNADYPLYNLHYSDASPKMYCAHKIRVSKKFISIYMLHFQLEYPAAMLQLPFSQFAGSRCYRICPPAIHSSLSHSTYKILNIIRFRYTEKNFSPMGWRV